MRMLLNVALRCWWADPDEETTATLLQTAESLGAEPDDPTLITVLGYGAPFERGRAVVERLAAVEPDALEHPTDLLNLGTAATGVGAFPLAAPLLDDAILRLRTRGEMVHLTQALVARMLEKNPDARPQSCREVREALVPFRGITDVPVVAAAGAAASFPS